MVVPVAISPRGGAVAFLLEFLNSSLKTFLILKISLLSVTLGVPFLYSIII